MRYDSKTVNQTWITVREYLLDRYDMEFISWYRSLKNEDEMTEYHEFMDTPIMTDYFRKQLDTTFAHLYRLFMKMEMYKTSREIIGMVKEVTKDMFSK